MSTGVKNNIHYMTVPGGLTDSNLTELKGEVNHILGEVIDNGLTKFMLDLSELSAVNTAATNLVFKVIEDCQTLQIKLRIVAKMEFARLLFGQDRLAKLALYKDEATALADF